MWSYEDTLTYVDAIRCSVTARDLRMPLLQTVARGKIAQDTKPRQLF